MHAQFIYPIPSRMNPCANATQKMYVGGVWGLAGPVAANSPAVLVSWVLFGTYYIVEGGSRTLRSGPFRWRIRMSDIHRAHPSRSPFSSPALSLDRLRIEYGESRHILVSPSD